MPGQLDPPNPDTFLPSARSVAFRKTVWEAAGGYPEWLYTGEDTLFDKKLKMMGFTFRFVGDAVVEWEPRQSWRKVARQFYLYSRGHGQLGDSGSSLAWMAKRVGVVVAAAVAGIWFWPAWLAIGLVFLWDHYHVVHGRAERVARVVGSKKAYIVTSLALWVIVFARWAGAVSGTIQRIRDPGKYKRQLDAYMTLDSEAAGS